ncbi:MAG: VanZ family protein [Phascolarctobacterium sp.]|nr:VanZ family protein [Phascolarctobacterium sp.]
MKYLWLLLTLGLTVGIFYISSQPMAVNGQVSRGLADMLVGFCNAAGFSLGANPEYTIRKLAHFLEFLLLAYLWCKTYSSFYVSANMSSGYILFLCLFTAVLDEFIQLHSQGRSSQITDVLLDFSAAFCAWLMYRIYYWSK